MVQLPASVLHAIVSEVAKTQEAWQTRIDLLNSQLSSETPRTLPSDTTEIIKRQVTVYRNNLLSLRLVNREFSKLASEFLALTVRATEAIENPHFRLGLAQGLRERFDKVVFDAEYSRNKPTQHDFLITLLPFFSNLSSLEFHTSSASLFVPSRDETYNDFPEQRRGILRLIAPRIKSISFVGLTRQKTIELLKIFTSVESIKLDSTLLSDWNATSSMQDLIESLPTSVRHLDLNRNPSTDQSKKSKKGSKSKDPVAPPPRWPDFVPGWPAITEVTLRFPTFDSADARLISTFPSTLKRLELRYASDSVDLDYNIPPSLPNLPNLKSLAVYGPPFSVTSLLYASLFPRKDNEAEEEAPEEWSAQRDIVTRVVSSDSPFVVAPESINVQDYWEDPPIHERTSFRPFTALQELRLVSDGPCLHSDDILDFVECHETTLRRFDLWNSGGDYHPPSIEAYKDNDAFRQLSHVSLSPYDYRAHVPAVFRRFSARGFFPRGTRDDVQQHRNRQVVETLESLLKFGQDKLAEIVEAQERGAESDELYRLAEVLSPLAFERAANYD